MTKIMVFSDSHGNTKPMLNAVRDIKPDVILHLGDYEWDADCFDNLDIPVRRVCGNCDLGSRVIESDTYIAPGGLRIVMVHGHKYQVKIGLGALLNMGNSTNADILLFGHTHKSMCEKVGNILLMNPGTAGVGSNTTCGLLTIEGKEAIGKILTI